MPLDREAKNIVEVLLIAGLGELGAAMRQSGWKFARELVVEEPHRLLVRDKRAHIQVMKDLGGEGCIEVRGVQHHAHIRGRSPLL